MKDRFDDSFKKKEVIRNSILENRKKRFSESDELDKDNFMVEGFEINPGPKKIKLNAPNKGADFEAPFCWMDNGMNIISLFKRTKSDEFKGDKDLEGNPFIYALKKKYDWSFDVSYRDIEKYLDEIVSDCEQLQKKYDTVIMIPSKSDLNEMFMNRLFNITHAQLKITSLFRKVKLNNDEPEQYINYEKLKEDRKDSPDIIDYLDSYLYNLNGSGKEFEAKDFDKDLLKYLNFLDISKDVNYVDAITDKSILILDDIYSSGNAVSQAVMAIKQNYAPKSITVVTLLSKLPE